MRLLFLAVLPLLANASGLMLPDDAEDGFALHFMNDDGTDVYVPESNFTQYNITVLPGAMKSSTISARACPPETNDIHNVPKGDRINCIWDYTVQDSDLYDAILGLSETLVCGYSITVEAYPYAKYKYVAAVQKTRNAVIYLCNYNAGPIVWNAPSLVNFMLLIWNGCNGGGFASWYSDACRHISWGFTSPGHAYCGPAQR